MNDHEDCVRPWGDCELLEMVDELVFDLFNDVTEDLYFIPRLAVHAHSCTHTCTHIRTHRHTQP